MLLGYRSVLVIGEGENLWILAVSSIGGMDTRGEINRVEINSKVIL